MDNLNSINTIEVDGVIRPRFNSNNQPIHSTEEGIVNFWCWFGDSRVVDEQGRPLVVHHGTAEKFSTFDHAKQDTNFTGDYGNGFCFIQNKNRGGKYASTAKGIRQTQLPRI